MNSHLAFLAVAVCGRGENDSGNRREIHYVHRGQTLSNSVSCHGQGNNNDICRKLQRRAEQVRKVIGLENCESDYGEKMGRFHSIDFIGVGT